MGLSATRVWSGLGLRARMGLLMAATVAAVVLVVTGTFVTWLQHSQEAALEGRAAVLRDALRRKGVAVARNVALGSSRAVAVNNFAFLTEIADATVHNDDDFVYVILMDSARRALVHTVPELANAVLDGPADRAAAAAATQGVVAQEITFRNEPVLEISVPIEVADRRWGTVRLGMALRQLNAELAGSAAAARQQVATTVAMSAAAAGVLLLLGVLCATAAAAGLLRPLRHLLAAANGLREGGRAAVVTARGSPEFRTLGAAFNDMAAAVLQREAALQEALLEAKSANRLKDEFLANVSHELRTPLNAIINIPAGLCADYQAHALWHCAACGGDFAAEATTGGAAVAAGDPCPACGGPVAAQARTFFTGDAAAHLRLLQRTVSSGRHLLGVVSDILDFSKLDAGHMALHRGPVEVDALVDEIRGTVTTLADAKQIEVAWPRPAGSRVWGDRIKLAQVLLNLIGNAIKFTPEGGKITVSERRAEAGDLQLFEVEDTGVGIPADKLDFVFESFRQLDGSHTRNHGGTGLGLAITRKLVALHGGEVWATSRLGHGSCFYFTVPRGAPPDFTPPPPTAAQELHA